MTSRANGLIACLFMVMWGTAQAGTICRSTSFAGFEAHARRAAVVVGPQTTDLSQARVYVEPVGAGFYYQTNYVEPGAAHPAKLLSEVALPLTSVLANLLYPTRDEALRRSAATAALAARVPVYAAAAPARIQVASLAIR